MNDRRRVVVIGAGIAGASAAWALAAEHDVVLLEMETQPGQHATGRSAAVLSETSGTAAVCALAVASREFLTDPPIARDLLSPRGLLWVASDSGRTELESIAGVAAGLGIETERLDVDAARRLVPALRDDWLAAALHEPNAMSIDVARLLHGFVAGLRERGGVVRLASPAVRLEPVAGGWRVDCGNATIDVDVVVDAAGGWADEVARRAGVTPLGLQPLVRTAFTFPAADVERWPLVMDAAGTFYFEPEGPGLLASPGDETPTEPCDARADQLAMAMAVDALAEATTIKVRGVRSAWAGMRTFAPDRIPVCGEDPQHAGFFWLAGQGGAGIKTAPALAELTAALVGGRALPPVLAATGLDPATLSPARLRPQQDAPAMSR